jgi:hypothetical protein
MRNGKLLYARTFPNGDDTLEWAEGERVEGGDAHQERVLILTCSGHAHHERHR